MIFKYINYFLITVWIIKFNLNGLNFADTWYKFIPTAEILDSVAKKTIVEKDKYLDTCDFKEIFNNLYDFDEENINTLFDQNLKTKYIKIGGEYQPRDCNTEYSVAIIVPYRNRKEQLHKFLKYFHYFLRRQHLHYRIYIVDQIDNLPFNRALLLNVGAVSAIKDRFPCLILTDVDLIPLNIGNLYVCTKQPRHMSTLINTFRYQLLYGGQFGGATAILSEQFESINGLSNEFYGWGGEDDDMSNRLKAKNYTIVRYDPEVSKYFMLKHEKQTPSATRFEVLKTGLKRANNDGINNIKSKITLRLEKLYTHITVEG